MSAKAVYEFTIKGTTAEGNKATFVGEVIDDWSDMFPPMSASDKAREAVEKLSPGFKFAGDVVVGDIVKVRQGPSMRMLKGKTKALQKKLGTVPVLNP